MILGYLKSRNTRQGKPCATMHSCCMKGQFAMPKPNRNCNDGINHYSHLPNTRNKATGRLEMNSDWSPGVKIEDMFVVLPFFIRKKLLHTHSIITLVLPWWFWCKGRMLAHAGVAWSQHARLVNPYLKVKYNFSSVPIMFWVSMWILVAGEQWWPVSVCCNSTR